MSFKKIILLGFTLIISSLGYGQVCLSNFGLSTGKATATDVTNGLFNTDANIDIATANGTNNTVSVFFSNGDGSFSLPLTLTPDINFVRPVAITSGDFNNDGRLDLATANNGSGNVTLFISNGKGGFLTPVNIAVDKALTDIVAGDFDLNGNIDIAVTSAGGNAPLYLLLNKGGASFTVNALGGGGSLARALTTNDFDQDGGLDFAITTDIGVDIFLSSTSFSKPFSLSVSGAFLGIDSKDINKDGIIDLVAANNSKNNVSVILGNAKTIGTFEKEITFNSGTNPVAIKIDDYNNDGIQDIANTSTNQINILQGNGNGGFSNPLSFNASGAKALTTINLDAKAPIDLIYTAPTLTNDVVLVTNTANTTQLSLTASATNVCPGTTITLQTDNKTYTSLLWYDGKNNDISTITVTPTVTTDYYVVGTSLTNVNRYCKDIANITVTVKAVPTATMSGSTSICAGNTASIPVTLTGTSPWTINYYQGTTLKTISGITTNPYLGITSGPTGVQYSLQSVSDASGCTGTVSGTATITQTPSPFATISYASKFCKNATNPTPSLGNGANLGTFTSSSTLLKVDINKGIVDLANSSPGTYIVTNTVTGTCGNVSDTARVVISPLPNAAFSYSQSAYCSNSTITPTSSYTGSGASYTSSPSGLTIDAFKGTISISSSTPGTYTVTNTVTGCGVGSATTSVTITKLPNASFSYTGNPFCKNASNPIPTLGANAKLETVTTVYTGLIVDKSTGEINLKSSTPGNNYMVTNTIAASGGCSQVTAYATVSIIDAPTAIFTSGATSICTGKSATLNLAFTGTPGYTYTFTDGSSYVANTNTASITVTPSSTTTYTLSSISDKYCTTNLSGSVQVTVNPYPVVSFNPVNRICLGSPAITLSATPSGGFFTGTNTNGSIFNPIIKGTHLVNYNYSALGCTTTVSKNIIVDTLPKVNLNASTNNICLGSNVTLTASGANTYTWSDGLPNSITNTVTPKVSTNYTVTGVDVNGCSNTSTAKITVYDLPIIKANATNNPICEGDNISLFGSSISTSGFSYIWNNGVFNNKAFIPSIGQTKYKVQATDINGCTGIDSITIVVNPKPIINLSPITSSICSSSNTNISISSSTPSVFNWTTTGSDLNIIGNFPGSSGSTSPALNYNIVQKLRIPTTVSLIAKYNITATSIAGCTSNTTNAFINIDSCSVKADFVENKKIVCIDNPVVNFSNVSITGVNSSYLWDFGPNAIPQTSTLATPPAVKFTTTGSQTIKLTVTDLTLKITNIKNSTVFVAPQPTIDAPNQSFCAGSNGVLLKASGANIYSSFANTIVKPTIDTTYQLIGTDLNGCKDTVAVQIFVNPVPNLKLIATPNVVCKGSTTQVSAVNQLSGILTNYAWNKNVLPNKSFDPIQTQYFTVTATDANGCIKKDSILVTVNPIPLVKASVSNTVACAGDSIKFTGTVTNLANISYAWDNGVINNKNFAITTTKKYTVTATETTTLCANTDTISVKVNELPNIILKNDTICEGANINLSASGAVFYQWFNGNTLLTNLVVNPSITTNYKVVGTDANGCSITKFKTVVVNQKPTITISNKNVTVCTGESTVLNAVSNATSIIWNDVNVTNNVAFKPTVSKQYIVTGSLLNCTKNDTVNLTVNPKPIINISASSTEVCEGEAILLNANGTAKATYSWNNGVSNNTFFTPLISGKYIATATFNGCSSLDSIDITVNKLPKLTISNNNTLCNGSATNIIVQTDITSKIKWVVTMTNVSGGQSDSIEILANSPGYINQILRNSSKAGKATYNITAYNKSCIGNTSQAIITVDTCNAKADFISNKTSICSLDSSVIYQDNSQGATTWNWDFGNGAIPQTSTSKNPQGIKYSTSGNKTISLIVTGLDGSSDTISKNLDVNLVETPIIQSINNDFNQDSLSFIANISNPTNGNTYNWIVNPSNSLSINNVTNKPTFTFKAGLSGKSFLRVISVNSQGCISDTSTSITIIRKGKFTISTPSAVYFNDSIPVNINFVGNAPFFLYYQNGTQRDTIKNINVNNLNFKISRIGTLSVSAFDKDSIPMIGVGNNVLVALDTAKTIISTTAPNCQVSTGKVYLNTTGGNWPLQLKIGTMSAITLKGNDTLNFDSGTYTGTITDKSGYISNINFTVDTAVVSKAIISHINGNSNYTNNPSSSNPLPILTTNSIVNATKYEWLYNNDGIDSLNGTNPTSKTLYIAPRYSGIVKFVVKAFNNNCLIAQSDSFTLTINPAAKLKSNLKNQLSVDLIGTNPFRVNYSIGSISKDTIIQDSIFVYEVKPNETIKINSVRDFYGNTTLSNIEYTGEILKLIKLSFYQAFSPNNDPLQLNEVFHIDNYIDPKSSEYINGEGKLTVYDRNGFEVYNVFPYKNDWNGKDSKGNDLPDGIYYFVVIRKAYDYELKKYVDDTYGNFVEIRR